jgi:iron transport multicopper oxidase
MFDVVRSAGSSDYNYVNPVRLIIFAAFGRVAYLIAVLSLKVRRDVVNLGDSGDNVTIRFTTDNPGPWILHW